MISHVHPNWILQWLAVAMVSICEIKDVMVWLSEVETPVLGEEANESEREGTAPTRDGHTAAFKDGQKKDRIHQTECLVRQTSAQ